MSKIRKATIFLFSIILIASISYIILYKLEMKKSEENFQQLIEKQEQMQDPETIFSTPQINPEESNMLETEEESEIKEILTQYDQLYNENPDMIGWIKIEDTNINYPIMQTKNDPNFYIHKDWDKNDSKAGTPYMDARCTLDESNNYLLYGHHMKNGSMFGNLKYYTDKSYYDKHQIIEFDTLYERSEYQIIGVFLSKVYYDEEVPSDAFEFYNYIDLNSKEEFEEYVRNIKKLSLYETGINAEYGDKLISLCTCFYHTENGRIVVVAKKI